MTVKTWVNYVGLIFLCLILLSTGFYFGYRYQETAQTKSAPTSSQTANSNSQTTPQAEVKALEVPGVHWIKLGQEPVCPETHPIKGKVESNVNLYYTTDNKSYKRIKPEVCFATENYAKDNAGFVKKY